MKIGPNERRRLALKVVGWVRFGPTDYPVDSYAEEREVVGIKARRPKILVDRWMPDLIAAHGMEVMTALRKRGLQVETLPCVKNGSPFYTVLIRPGTGKKILGKGSGATLQEAICVAALRMLSGLKQAAAKA